MLPPSPPLEAFVDLEVVVNVVEGDVVAVNITVIGMVVFPPFPFEVLLFDAFAAAVVVVIDFVSVVVVAVVATDARNHNCYLYEWAI